MHLVFAYYVPHPYFFLGGGGVEGFCFFHYIIYLFWGVGNTHFVSIPYLPVSQRTNCQGSNLSPDQGAGSICLSHAAFWGMWSSMSELQGQNRLALRRCGPSSKEKLPASQNIDRYPHGCAPYVTYGAQPWGQLLRWLSNWLLWSLGFKSEFETEIFSIESVFNVTDQISSLKD